MVTATDTAIATETGTVMDMDSPPDMYTTMDKVVDTVTDNDTEIEININSAEGMFIAMHTDPATGTQ